MCLDHVQIVGCLEVKLCNSAMRGVVVVSRPRRVRKLHQWIKTVVIEDLRSQLIPKSMRKCPLRYLGLDER